MHLFYQVIISFFFLISISFSQVNTEKLRITDVDEGFLSKTDLAIGINEGNIKFFSFLIQGRADYVHPKFHTFVTALIDFRAINERTIADRGFIHGRFIFNARDYIMPELFVQEEYNEFVFIKSRRLAGGGLRMRLFKNEDKIDTVGEFSMYLGTGFMYEFELVRWSNNELITKFLRSTNYLSIAWQPTSNLRISNSVYFQPEIRRIRDHRVLNSFEMSFSITKHLSFNTLVNYRYDREPPTRELKMFDFEIKNGISLVI